MTRTDFPITIPQEIADLTKNRQLLLCAAAYTGECVDSEFINSFAKKFDISKTNVCIDVSRLQDKGLIERKYINWMSSYYVSPKYHVYALFLLFTKYFDTVKSIPKVRHVGMMQTIAKQLSSCVSNIVMSYLSNDSVKLTVPDFNRLPDYTKQYAMLFATVAHEEVMLPLLGLLKNDMLRMIFDYNVTFYAEKDVSKPQALLRNMWDKYPRKRKELTDFASAVAINVFFSNGEWIFDEYKIDDKNYHYLLACAIREAYRRNYKEAYALMLKSLKLNNKGADAAHKNIFSGYIANYYLLLVYVLEGSNDAMKRLEQASRKKPLIEDRSEVAALALAVYYRDTTERLPMGNMSYALYTDNNDQPRQGYEQLVYLIARYFDVNPTLLTYARKKPDLSPEKYIPTSAILRHELSAYIPITDKEKKRLEQLYGGKPLLSSIYRKQQWELILEDIYRKESGGNAATADILEQSRGMYLFNKHNSYVEVREQSRLKSGAWGKGKRLSDSGYSSGKFAMDALDRKIYEANRSTGRIGSMPLLTTVIPHLVGTNDRLYLGTYDLDPVTVASVKPFISLVKDKKGIHLKTNLPSEANLDMAMVYHFDDKTMRLTYYPMDAKEHQLLRQLTSLGTLPLEAEPLLQKVFPVLNGKVEVHTDFIEGAEQLKTEKGQTVICLRIVPEGPNYILTALITPLTGGSQMFTPGKGERTIYDERDGERYEVSRNLRGESRNLQVFTDYLDDEDIVFSDSYAMLLPEELIGFMAFAHEHTKEGYIEWPDGQRIRLQVADPSSWSVSLKKKNGWFDIEGDVKVDDDTVLTVAQLLDMVSESRGRFVKLGEDQYLALSESLRKQLQRLSAIAVSSRGKMHIPNIGIALIGDALSGDMEIKHPKAVDELRTKIRQSAKLQPVVPDELNATLRDYQLDGYQWMSRLDSWGAGACLSDDMGLGKTVQAIAFILDKQREGATLVVAPASVVPNWKSELHRFAPTMRVVILNEESDRQQAIEDADAGTVIVTTYGLLITQEEALAAKQWATICLDEAHTIKNRDTKMSAVCMKLQSQHRIILTGTPLQNHLGELWNLFQFVNPGLLGSYEQFQKKFINPIESGSNEDRRQQLRRMIKPFMLRRTKQEVAKELPDKEEITLHVELSEDEMAVYEVIRRRAKKELEDIERSGKKVNMNALAEITRLRMAACSAQLAEKKWKGKCAKLEQFTDLVSELRQSGHRALVFSQFTSFLEMAKKAIASCDALKDLKFFYLDGSTPMKKREEMVKAFQKGECDLFIISLKAGGLGLNLTGANYVIHLDPWWNPAIEQQATDRAHRIGQKDKVTVYHIIASNTIEEKILRLHEHKRDLATSLLEGTNQSHKITAADLLNMIDGE